MPQILQSIGLKRHKPISPVPAIGDRVDVHVRILEGDKERIQVFQGVVLKMNGKGVSRSFTVRKISHGVGVERTFPLSSPVLAKVEVLSKSKVRRAKLYYTRKLKGRAGRLTSAFFNQSGKNSDLKDSSLEQSASDENSKENSAEKIKQAGSADSS